MSDATVDTLGLDLPPLYHILAMTPETREAERVRAATHLAELPDDAPPTEYLARLDTLALLEAGQGNCTECATLREHALIVAKQAFGVEAPETLHCMLLVASAYLDLGRYDAALAFSKFVVERLESHAAADHPDHLTALGVIALSDLLSGRWHAAEAGYARIVELSTRIYGENHPRTALARNGYGVALIDQRRFMDGDAAVRLAYESLEAVRLSDHAVAQSILSNLSFKAERDGDTAQALQWNERTRALCDRYYSSDHPSRCFPLERWGELSEDPAQAEVLFRESVTIRETRLGPKHPLTGVSLFRLAIHCLEQGDEIEGERLLKRALHIQLEHQREHFWAAIYLTRLGNLYRDRGELRAAEHYFQQAVDIGDMRGDRNQPYLMSAAAGLANSYRFRGLLREAAPLFEWAAVISEAAFGKIHENTADCLLSAGAARVSYDVRRAIRLLENSVAVMDTLHEPQHPSNLLAYAVLASACLENRDWARAEALFTNVLTVYSAQGEPEGGIAEEILQNNLGQAHEAQGRLAIAEDLYRTAFTKAEQRRGLIDTETANICTNLGNILKQRGKRAEAVEYIYLAERIRGNVAARKPEG